jgi:hypothetical protein
MRCIHCVPPRLLLSIASGVMRCPNRALRSLDELEFAMEATGTVACCLDASLQATERGGPLRCELLTWFLSLRGVAASMAPSMAVVTEVTERESISRRKMRSSKAGQSAVIQSRKSKGSPAAAASALPNLRCNAMPLWSESKPSSMPQVDTAVSTGPLQKARLSNAG